MTQKQNLIKNQNRKENVKIIEVLIMYTFRQVFWYCVLKQVKR